MDNEFNFDIEVNETNWLVDNLIPLGHLCVVISQAGVGKSLLAECLAVNITHSIDFIGRKTQSCNALIIDQDTPTDVIQKRLVKFSKGLNTNRNCSLFLESMRGYQLKDHTLTTVINDYPSAKFVLIDSLHSVIEGLNSNGTSDMSKLFNLKEKCLTTDKVIWFNHHISEKCGADIKALMTKDPHKLSMGSSAIIQQADTYYIVGAVAQAGITERIYLRTVSKRQSIPIPPIVLRVVQTSNSGEIIEFEGNYEPDLDEVEQDIMTLFREQNVERTVKEVYDSMGHQHGEVSTREGLASLDKKGKLLMSRHKSNLFKYRLP